MDLVVVLSGPVVPHTALQQGTMGAQAEVVVGVEDQEVCGSLPQAATALRLVVAVVVQVVVIPPTTPRAHRGAMELGVLSVLLGKNFGMLPQACGN